MMYLNSPHLLIIEDDETISRLLKTALSQQNFQITLAIDGSEGIFLFEKNPEQFDLILADYHMPGLTGLETFLHLKKLAPQVLFCLMTGGGLEPSIQEKCLETGVAAILQKPFPSIIQLGEQLRELINNHDSGKKKLNSGDKLVPQKGVEPVMGSLESSRKPL